MLLIEMNLHTKRMIDTNELHDLLLWTLSLWVLVISYNFVIYFTLSALVVSRCILWYQFLYLLRADR